MDTYDTVNVFILYSLEVHGDTRFATATVRLALVNRTIVARVTYYFVRQRPYEPVRSPHVCQIRTGIARCSHDLARRP